MSNNTEEDFLTPFNKLITGLDKHDQGEKLFLLSGLVELLRHTKSATDILYMAELLAAIPYVDIPRVPFSFTKTLLSDKYRQLVKKTGVPDALVPEVLQMSLLLFLDELNSSAPDVPDEARLQELVTGTAELMAESVRPEEPTENPKLPVVSPEVFNARLVRRVFEPVSFTPDVAAQLGLQLVTYRGMMPDGKLGPTLRGLSLPMETQHNVFFETGEFISVPADYEHLAVSTAPEDFKNLNPAVMLAVTAAAEELDRFSLLTPEQLAMIKAGKLGKLHALHWFGVTDVDDIKPLEHVFDMGREAVRMGVTGATGPVGATVRFPVPATDMTVILDAQQDTYGPYSTARLVQTGPDGKDVVLMRHEVPRHYSLRGVYLFPLQDRLVSLTCIF
jgi:hypothetical protein